MKLLLFITLLYPVLLCNAFTCHRGILIKKLRVQSSPLEVPAVLNWEDTKIKQSFGQVVDVIVERKVGQVFSDFKSYLDDKFVKFDEKFDKKFDKIDEKFAKMDEKFDDKFAKIDEKFDKIDDKFDKINDKFAKIDEKFVMVDGKFTKMDETLRWFRPVLAIGGIIVGISVEKFFHFFVSFFRKH